MSPTFSDVFALGFGLMLGMGSACGVMFVVVAVFDAARRRLGGDRK